MRAEVERTLAKLCWTVPTGGHLINTRGGFKDSAGSTWLTLFPQETTFHLPRSVQVLILPPDDRGEGLAFLKLIISDSLPELNTRRYVNDLESSSCILEDRVRLKLAPSHRAVEAPGLLHVRS